MGKSLYRTPAVENQATDRAFRIGEKQTVNVCRLISAETFEEKINAMTEAKKVLADMMVESGETGTGISRTTNSKKSVRCKITDGYWVLVISSEAVIV